MIEDLLWENSPRSFLDDRRLPGPPKEKPTAIAPRAASLNLGAAIRRALGQASMALQTDLESVALRVDGKGDALR